MGTTYDINNGSNGETEVSTGPGEEIPLWVTVLIRAGGHLMTIGLQWLEDRRAEKAASNSTTSSTVGSGITTRSCWYDPGAYWAWDTQGIYTPPGGWPDPVWICEGSPPATKAGVGIVGPGFQEDFRGSWIRDVQNGNGNNNKTDYKPFLIAAAATIVAAFIVTRKR